MYPKKKKRKKNYNNFRMHGYVKATSSLMIADIIIILKIVYFDKNNAGY